MKTGELFRQYNVRRISASRRQYVMMMLSVLVAVTVCLAVPQAIGSSRRHIDVTARTMVGADLRVIGEYPSASFARALASLDHRAATRVEERQEYSASIKSGATYRLVMVIGGDGALGADEVRVSRTVADQNNLRAGDALTLQGRTYRVAGVEPVASGVNSDAEILGYVKVREPAVRLSSAQIYLITSPDPARVRSILHAAEPQFTYTTVEDQKASMRDQVTANSLALSALSTMCLLLTVLALFGCVLMIVRQRLTDVAIMDMLSVRRAVVRSAFVRELQVMLLPAIVLGCLASRLLAWFILRQKDVPLTAPWSRTAVGGALLTAAYFALVRALGRVVGSANSLDVLKGGGGGARLRIASAAGMSAGVTVLTLFVYALVGIGNGGAFVTGLGLMLLLTAFFGVTLVLVKVLTLYRPAGRWANYTVNRLRRTAGSFSLTTVSMALLLWFVLFGFAFSHAVGASFTSQLTRSLSYNYMVAGKDSARIGQVLSGGGEVQGSTALYCSTGLAVLGADRKQPVTLAGIADAGYQRRFGVTSGKDVVALGPGEISVSRIFASKNHLKLGDVVRLDGVDPALRRMTVAGLYESGGISNNFLLRHVSPGTTSTGMVYLVQASGPKFLNSLPDVTVVNVSMIGEGLVAFLSDYLDLFKYMCFFCVLAALVFNLNLIQLAYVDVREIVVVKALGIPTRFLSRSALARMTLEALLSGLLAVLLFVAAARAAISLVVHGPATFPWGTVLGPTGLTIGLLFGLYAAVELAFVRRASSSYDVLREQV